MFYHLQFFIYHNLDQSYSVGIVIVGTKILRILISVYWYCSGIFNFIRNQVQKQYDIKRSFLTLVFRKQLICPVVRGITPTVRVSWRGYLVNNEHLNQEHSWQPCMAPCHKCDPDRVVKEYVTVIMICPLGDTAAKNYLPYLHLPQAVYFDWPTPEVNTHSCINLISSTGEMAKLISSLLFNTPHGSLVHQFPRVFFQTITYYI